MDRSLSALLPVRNIESTLAARVHELLEVLPELTSRFELVIVDDCSCDATIEVADEIADSFPQLQVRRHAKPLGRAETIRTALERSRGEVVFLEDEDCGSTLHEVRSLWRSLEKYPIVFGRPVERIGSGSAPWDGLDVAGVGGCLMSVREALAPCVGLFNDQNSLRKVLARRGESWAEIRLSLRKPPMGPHRVASLARRLFAVRLDPAQNDSHPETVNPPKRPNYLTKIKEFTFGE